MKKFTCLSALAILSLTELNAVSYEWTNNTGGPQVWELMANWTPAGTFPSMINDIATFGQFMAGLAADTTIIGPGMSEILGHIIFAPNTTGFTYQLADMPGDYYITMIETGMTPSIQAQTGAQTAILCNAGFTLGDTTTLNFDVASGITLTLNSGFDGGGMMPTSGNVSIVGPGTVVYSGDIVPNLYFGTTTVSNGTLQLNKTPVSAGFAFQGPMLISGGTVQHMANFQNIDATTWTIDSGTWDLGGFAESILSLTFNGGTFTGPGSTLNLVGTGTVLSMRNTTLDTLLALNNGGVCTIAFDATNNGTAILAGTLDLAPTQRFFNIASGTADIDMIISASITNVGGSIVKNGPGTLELTGTNTYLMGTTVSEGTLLIGPGGSLANGTVAVLAGAILGGTGTIGGGAATVNNNGTVAPGLSPGVLTINGNYVQGAGGALAIELLSPTEHDKLVVIGGSADLHGALDLTLLPGHSLYGNNTVTIVDNTAGTGLTLGSAFDTVNKFGFPALSTAEVSYTSNTALLSLFIPLAPVSPANSVAFSAPIIMLSNQNTLNFMRHLSYLRSYMEPIEEEPLAASGPASSNLIASSDILNSVLDKDPNRIVLKVDSPTTPIRLQPCTRNSWGVFADGVGSVGNVYRTSTQDPFRYYSAGGLIGFDYVGERFGVGFSPGYEFLQANALNHQSKFNIHSAEGTLFATLVPFEQSNWFVDLIGGGAVQWYHFQRNTPVGTVSGKPRGWQANAYSDFGYNFERGCGRFSPFLGLGYVYISVPSYTESGSIFQTFTIGKETLQSLRTSLGATGSYTFSCNCFSFTPEARFLWQREFLNHNQNVSFASAPLAVGSQMQAFGLGRNTLIAGAVLRFRFSGDIDMDGSYDYEWNRDFHSHLFLLGLAKRF